MEKGSIKILMVLLIALSFITGILASFAVEDVYIDKESPYLVSFNGGEQPSDWIDESRIQIMNDRVIIYVDEAVLSKYAETGSMLPTFGDNANGIRIIPKSAEQINIGDIITFESGDKLIVHRVVEKGKDEKGTWFITKGDNNSQADEKIYFEDVRYVTIAVIY